MGFDPAPSTLCTLSLPEFADSFRRWITAHHAELAPMLVAHADYDERVVQARALRHMLAEHGWGRVGWPEEFGGLGGHLLHRSIVLDELYQVGWPGPAIFEHLEIIAPTLIYFADPGFVAKVLPAFLDGTWSWSQGFSEPEAGSDLASLRTTATIEDDHFVVTGNKIWTSWSVWARWCLALVRTGSPESRHKGLTMIAIDLESVGIEVRPIRQANGTNELAEVWFDQVRVPRSQLIGEINGGWRVALHLLSRERGTASWLKQGLFQQLLSGNAKLMREDHDRLLGNVALQVAGVRAAAASLLVRDANGGKLGPEAAFNKLLATRTEQEVFNLLREVDGMRIAAPASPDDDVLEQEYLFSRIVTLYGGSQQMQLITVARHILGLGDA